MDLEHDGKNIIEEEEEGEDRISNLPDDIIHHILAPLDLKCIVQTSTLSRRWEHIWISTAHLIFNSCAFPTLPLFAKFVKHVLARRNNHVEVSKVQLTFTGAGKPFVVKSIVNYAYLHSVRELNVTWCTRKFLQFPQCLFRSHTLKHLTLETNEQTFYLHKNSCIPNLAWDFPALETVVLIGMHFGDHGDESLDLFSKCVNLKDLTLHKCCMYGLNIFNIYAPELSNLTITYVTSFPNVIKVFAPQLEILTASLRGTIDRSPFFFDSLHLSTEEFNSLKEVNLSMSMPHTVPKRFVPLLLDLFRKLGSTKNLVINNGIIETLSLALNEVSHEPCPFKNLKRLKVYYREPFKHPVVIPLQFIDYFLEKSPSARMSVDVPMQVVPQKRSRRHGQDGGRKKATRE